MGWHSWYKIKMRIKSMNIVKLLLKYRDNRQIKEKSKALKEEGIELIKNVESALEDSNILFFATCGTLLGVVRNHDFIPGDDDLDYGLFTPTDFNWEQFESMLNNENLYKIREFIVNGVIREQTYKKGRLTVDFFTFFKHNEEYLSYGFFRKEGIIYSSPYEFNIRETKFPKVTKNKKADFLGTTISIPDNEEDVLVCCYGRNWRIPDSNWDDNSKVRNNIRILSGFATVKSFENK